MKKLISNNKWKKHLASRSRYELKRRTPKYKQKRRRNILEWQEKTEYKKNYVKKEYVRHQAPSDFSIIKNTNPVLEYFDEAHKLFKDKEKLNFDISDITNLTSDAITFMVANIHNPKFTLKNSYKGNAPKEKELQYLFTHSGFYRFVASSFKDDGSNGLLHKENDYKVRPLIAKKATLAGTEFTFKNSIPFEPIYEILVECMSNTNNHASDIGECKWWLYVYNNPQTQNTEYSFLDLGVGIFESMRVKNYISKALKGSAILPNSSFSKDLLNGKIQSRMGIDNEIRGKGIPQIVGYSKRDCFKEFYIITNDVKIDLKTNNSESLNSSLKGTFLYFELQNI